MEVFFFIYPNHTTSKVLLVISGLRPVQVTTLPLNDPYLSPTSISTPFSSDGWLPCSIGNANDSLTRSGISCGSGSLNDLYWYDFRSLACTHGSVVHDHWSEFWLGLWLCLYMFIRGRILWKVYWEESKMFFCFFLTRPFFARVHYAQPIYLGHAARTMREDSEKVWYGMVSTVSSI